MAIMVFCHFCNDIEAHSSDGRCLGCATRLWNIKDLEFNEMTLEEKVDHIYQMVKRLKEKNENIKY